MHDKISKSIIFLSVFIFSVVAVNLNQFWLFAFVFFAFGFFFFKKQLVTKKFFIVLAVLFLFGALYSQWRMPKGDFLQKFSGCKADMIGVVDSPPKKKGAKVKFYLKVISIDTEKGSLVGDLGTSAVSIYNARDIKIGDKIKVKGKLYKPFSAKNLGQFDYAGYLSKNGIFTTFYSGNYKVLDREKSVYYQMMRVFSNFRNKIMMVHQKYLGENSNLLGGIIFGYRAVDVKDDIKQDFINSGLLHLLSASGLHVGLILGIWYFFTRVFRFSYRISILSGGLVVFLYSCLTGFPPSILRAMLMAEFILFGKLIDRKADNLALLLFVCSIMLLFNPAYASNIGFQLSFVVTFGILFCLPILLDKVTFLPGYLSGIILVPFIAQIWALPLLVFHFNNISLYSVFANVLVMPFMAVVSFLGFISSIFALFSWGDSIAFLLNKLIEPFLNFLAGISQYFSSIPNSVIFVAKPVLFSILLVYLFLLLYFYCLKNTELIGKFKFHLFIILCGVVLLNLNIDFSEKLTFTFFSVGNSDAMLIELPNKKKFMVDTGRTGFGGYNSGKTVINEYFKDVGIRNLNSVVLTHPDSDHIGGAVDVLRYSKAKEIYMINKKSDTKIFKNLLSYIIDNKLNVIYAKNGEKLHLDGRVTVKLIVPKGFDSSTYNDDSIITYIKYENFSALLMGDNERQVYDVIKKQVKPPVTLLKVGHHGSFKSLSGKMLDFLEPEVAVICTGRNGFGHPHKRILDLLKSKNIKTLRTDKNNMIEISTSGGTFSLKGYDPEAYKMRNLEF